MTGLRLGYFAIKDAALRARAVKVIAYTTSNVNSVVQYGGIGALEGPQDCVAEYRDELRARRDLFYAGLARAKNVLSILMQRHHFDGIRRWSERAERWIDLAQGNLGGGFLRGWRDVSSVHQRTPLAIASGERPCWAVGGQYWHVRDGG